MKRYVARRILSAVVVIWAAFTISFLLLYLLPADPIAIKLDAVEGGGRGGSGSVSMPPEQVAEIMARYGYDRPLIVQYFLALGRMLGGDLGTSITTGIEVRDSLVAALPQTLQLASVALLIGVLVGVLVGVLSNLVAFRWLRQLLQSLPPLAAAIPTFWFGLVLLQVFSFRLGWFPPWGNSGFASVVLPALTLSLPTAAVMAQVLSKSLREVLASPYIETARAKGASRLRVHLRHAFRNAMLPSLTVVGLTVGNLLAGSVVVETVYARDGLGRLTETAVDGQDTPVVLAVVVISAVVFALVNLLVDLLYPVVDPRIRRATTAVA
ncbi:ABC transporter permease [Nakamurella leprariae]|uniref:ABC transporter permease n=1 Tax=Nakamurella leprariae TaxID=2803911 RepID=A0A938YBS8_9ACTN|nr:ABC transporter permease [Nakamurella leprariae]MBM9466701.1 ABC transporter permease [Nakamurella leprariae]